MSGLPRLSSQRKRMGPALGMTYMKPDKKAVKAWRLGRLISFVAILAAALGSLAVYFFLPEARDVFKWIMPGTGLLALYKLAGLFVYPAIEYRQWAYMITDEKVEIIHGIFYITRDVIPVVRIQNITVKQGPIYRRYGLYTVEIALASGTFQIVGLTGETADEIAEAVREKLYSRLEKEGNR